MASADWWWEEFTGRISEFAPVASGGGGTALAGDSREELALAPLRWTAEAAVAT
jgi:hypothetical protein